MTKTASKEKALPATKKINVALQGGGAHGAFTWGVIDKIIEDGRLEIDGLCGTSAGAMNAVVYGYGKMIGGTEHARQLLHDFWQDISKAGQTFGSISTNPLHHFFGGRMQEEMTFAALETMTRIWSPYQLNPLNYNPLRQVLEKHVDFGRIKACNCTNMFVCATSARTGKPKIFKNGELTADAVLASACLPFMFQAVEIDGEAYWDGGYIGNPALYPMIYGTGTQDILIVHINPIERNEIPKDAYSIMNRVNEVTFNSSLIKEMRAIAFVQKIIDEGWLKDEYKSKLRRINMHAIRTEEALKELSIASKFSTSWDFLTDLRDLGRARAQLWLDENFEHVGNKSTIDIHETYL